MRNKVMLSAALTCLVGVSALLTPAAGQRRYPPCGALVYSDCPETAATQICADDHGALRAVVCNDFNTWELYSPH